MFPFVSQIPLLKFVFPSRKKCEQLKYVNFNFSCFILFYLFIYFFFFFAFCNFLMGLSNKGGFIDLHIRYF